jgi:dTMP kinase
MMGLFITFEGGEGAGKSTQVKLLVTRLLSLGRDAIATREPGGSGGGEAIRELLVSGDTGRWSPEAEALLNYAARDAHLRQRVRPALAKGEIVVCDRFMDSTRAYQGYAGGCPMAMIDELERQIVGATRPALTLIFDLDPQTGLDRARSRGASAEDRFERKGLDFHQRLRDGFKAIAAADSTRCKIIDAAESETKVAESVWRHVEPWL